MIKRFFKWYIPAKDKLEHYYTGELPAHLGLVCFFIWKKMFFLMVFGLVAGLYKELIHDKLQGNGQAEVPDFIQTFAPSLRNFIIVYIMIIIFKIQIITFF